MLINQSVEYTPVFAQQELGAIDEFLRRAWLPSQQQRIDPLFTKEYSRSYSGTMKMTCAHRATVVAQGINHALSVG